MGAATRSMGASSSAGATGLSIFLNLGNLTRERVPAVVGADEGKPGGAATRKSAGTAGCACLEFGGRGASSPFGIASEAGPSAPGSLPWTAGATSVVHS